MNSDNVYMNNRGKSGLYSLLVRAYSSFAFTVKNPSLIFPLFGFAARRIFERKKYIFLLASPTHNNMGDQMIACAMAKWSEMYFGEYAYKSFDDGIYKDWAYFDSLRLVIRKRDMIFLRGGGSVGDRYSGYEEFVRYVLKSYPKNKIVMFPQSVFFSHTPTGEKEKAKTAAAYDAHPNFILFTRDEASYALAKSMLRRTKVSLCPDIAMYLFGIYSPEKYERSGVFFCLRIDGENRYSKEQLSAMIKAVKSSRNVTVGDMGAESKVNNENREAEIKKLLARFSKSRVAVTDRFHGVISAVLTGTPCIALRSADHKIISGIKWFKDLDFVFYASSPEEVPELIEKAMSVDGAAPPDFSPYFDKLFEEIANG